MMIAWRKSSHSGSSSENLNCVEVAALPTGAIGIRDGKNPQGPHLTVPAKAFGMSVRRIQAQH